MLSIKAAKEAAISTTEIAKLMKMKEFRVTKYLASVAKVPTEILENAIRLAYETDKALKSEPSDPWVLLDMLAIRIYAPKSLRKG
jgi:DNA polymerase III delta subunit